MFENGVGMENFNNKEYMKTPHNDCDNMELAQAYVPFQKLGHIYSPEEGLIKGTIFPELYRPYEPRGKKY